MARRRLQRNELPGGRWSVRDVELGYRICNFHQHHKDANAPWHVHYPEDVYVGACQVRSARDAERVMTAYRNKHAAFNLEALIKEIEEHGDSNDAPADRPPTQG